MITALDLEAEKKRDDKICSDWLLFIEERRAEYERRLLAGEMDAQFEAWEDLIEYIEAGISWKEQIFLRLRREYRNSRGRVGWVEHVQRRYCEEIAKREGKQLEDCWLGGRNTFTHMWERIISYTARNAAGRGLLKE